MGDAGKDVISILQYLLPGFLAAWVFYGLTPYERPSQFERVVQALIFTLIVQAIVFVEKIAIEGIGPPLPWGGTNESSRIVASAATALIIGCIFALCANRDLFHTAARKIGITVETSYPSEWFSALCSNITYVVLQLDDERRIYGWPREWPSDPKEGHFLIEDPSWLTPDGDSRQLTGVSSILISVSDVKWIEFMKQTWTN